MIVVCTLTVIVMHFASTADVEGRVISSSDTKYLVDFSKDAAKRGFEGDYSQKIVDKNDCVEKK